MNEQATSAGADDAAPLTLAAAQAAVDAWIGQFRDGYWPPLANLARLVEEVGALARELNHRYGPKTKKPEEPSQDLALELADTVRAPGTGQRAEDRHDGGVPGRAGQVRGPGQGEVGAEVGGQGQR